MQNSVRFNEVDTLADPNASADISIEEEDDFWPRNFGDVLRDVRDHLTKEELLTIAVYKNSKKRKQNKIYQEFLKIHCNKTVSGSAITHKKKRTLAVLGHVGALLKFKRTHGIDSKLRDILTNRQFVLLMLYEKRIKRPEIQRRLNYKHPTGVSHTFRRVVDRLKESVEPDIKRYLVLLGNVLWFSRSYPTSRR